MARTFPHSSGRSPTPPPSLHPPFPFPSFCPFRLHLLLRPLLLCTRLFCPFRLTSLPLLSHPQASLPLPLVQPPPSPDPFLPNISLNPQPRWRVTLLFCKIPRNPQPSVEGYPAFQQKPSQPSTLGGGLPCFSAKPPQPSTPGGGLPCFSAKPPQPSTPGRGLNQFARWGGQEGRPKNTLSGKTAQKGLEGSLWLKVPYDPPVP